MKRGQMEIIGLVVIVILIALGMIFLALFALKNPDQKKIFTRKELASSTMAAMLKVTVDDELCNPLARNQVPLPLGSKILEDCALHETPGVDSTYRCNNQHSCQFFEKTVEQILEKSVGSLQKNYEFEAAFVSLRDNEQEPFISIKSPLEAEMDEKVGCLGRSVERDSSGPFPLQVDGAGLVQSQLFICD